MAYMHGEAQTWQSILGGANATWYLCAPWLIFFRSEKLGSQKISIRVLKFSAGILKISAVDLTISANVLKFSTAGFENFSWRAS